MNSSLSTGYENDVAWKIKHRVLKTLDYAKSWGAKQMGIVKAVLQSPKQSSM